MLFLNTKAATEHLCTPINYHISTAIARRGKRVKGLSLQEKRAGVAGSENRSQWRGRRGTSVETVTASPEVTHKVAGRGRSFLLKLWPEGKRDLGQE